MDLNDLNNKQVILLTMFVSFIMSIGTGILTAAILQEAPRTITQNVNRVVERTIERVVTGTSTPEKITPAPVQTVTKEVTVYAKEDDLVVSAVEKNLPRIARIYAVGVATGTTIIAVGPVVSRDGMIAVSTRDLGAVPSKRYAVKIGDTDYTAEPLQKPVGADIAFLQIKGLGEGQTLNAVTWNPKSIAKVAQGVVVIGGDGGDGIQRPSIAKLHWSKEEGTSTPPSLLSLETTPKISSNSGGALIVDLDGQAIGIATWSDADNMYLITPMSVVLGLIGQTVTTDAKSGALLPSAEDKTANS